MRAIVLGFPVGVLTVGTALYRWAGLHRGSRPADLTVIWGDEPESLDPVRITGTVEACYIDALLEGLVSYHPETLDPVPAVAERWEVSPDGLRYRFFLRPAARWSNGDPVTAHDFVWSLRRVMDPATACDYAYILYPVKNAEAINTGTIADTAQLGVTAVDDRTLDIVLESPCAYFLDLCGFMTAIPVHRATVEAHGDRWILPEHFVGNGPYIIEEWVHHDRIVMVPNPRYWDRESVHLNRLVSVPVKSETTAFNFYLSGIVDWIRDPNVPTAVISEVRRRPDYSTFAYLGTYYVRFNLTKPPFGVLPPGTPGAPEGAAREEALRRARLLRVAFCQAADKRGITERITKAGQIPTHRFVPPGMRLGGLPYDESAPGDPFPRPSGHPTDVEAAKALFREACPDPTALPSNIRILVRGDGGKDIAEVLQESWKKAFGVGIQIQQQEWKVYLQSMKDLSFELIWSGWIGDYNDPNTFLDMWLTGGGNNATGFSDARYDEILRLAARETDPRKRRALFHEAETILIEKVVPICPIYHPVSYYLMNPRIRGMSLNLRGIHPAKHYRMTPLGEAEL